VFNVVYFSLFLASIRPHIIDEQEAFIHWVLEIPFDEQRCRDLITLDTLHAYCGGLEPCLWPVDLTLILVGVSPYILDLSSHLHHTFAFVHNIHFLFSVEMVATRQRALVRASAAVRKQKEKEGASFSAPKGITKGKSKRKSDGKEDRPLKKGLSIPASDKKKPKQPSPPKPSHEAGKGLMTACHPGNCLLSSHA